MNWLKLRSGLISLVIPSRSPIARAIEIKVAPIACIFRAGTGKYVQEKINGLIIKENQQSVGKYWIKRLFLVAFQSKINVNKTFKNIIIKLTAKSISSIII